RTPAQSCLPGGALLIVPSDGHTTTAKQQAIGEAAWRTSRLVDVAADKTPRAARPSGAGKADTLAHVVPLRARRGESWRRLTVTRGQTSQDVADQRHST